MGAQLRLLAATALAVSAPTLLVRKSRVAMNREDYLHEASLAGGRYGRKDDEVKIADLQKQVKELTDALKTRDAEIVAAVKKAQDEITATGKLSAESKAALDAMGAKATEVGNRLVELEQKMAKHAEGARQRTADQMSPGAQIIAMDEWKAFVKQKGGRATFSIKAITSQSTGSGGAGDLVVPQRLPDIYSLAQRQLTIRALLGAGRTTSSSIDYVKETGFTNNAAPVAETTQKPESNIDFQLFNAPVRTIAHWVIASKQILDDAPQLQSYIDGRLRFGLAIVEENQLLAGDGTGQNLEGLIPQATAYNRPESQTKIDVIRRSMTQVRLAEYRADGVIINPEDWEEIELTKTDQGAYVWANPASLLSPTIWGLPVVDTVAIAAGNFLTGAFKLSATVWDREDANVQVSTEDRDNFIKNMVTIRAEERLALTVFRPEALIYGNFATAISN